MGLRVLGRIGLGCICIGGRRGSPGGRDGGGQTGCGARGKLRVMHAAMRDV